MSCVTPNVVKSGDSPSRLLIFGCGYLGNRVAAASVSAGHIVWATTRRPARAEELAAAGLNPLLADWNDPGTLQDLPEVDRIVVAVSYDRQSEQSRYESQVGGFDRLLRQIPEHVNICYISTTGVYHQTGGAWVDELSPALPTREGGKVHLLAEQRLQQQRPDSPWTVLRLAGIYGPGRVPRAADVIAGKPIRSPQDGFLNLIHVEDAAAVVNACWESAKERLYVVSDDCPVLRGDFYREIARQCDAPPPTFLPPPADAPVSMRSESDKRVRNQRMKRDLLGKLRYPSYREGLSDVLG